MNVAEIRIAIAGVGNCASSLVQGIAHYARLGPDDQHVGLAYPRLGGDRGRGIRGVAALRTYPPKVGRPLEEAILAPPNNTQRFFTANLPPGGVTVRMGNILDGVAPHMEDFPPDRRFEPASETPADAAQVLRESDAQILVNYLPVG